MGHASRLPGAASVKGRTAAIATRDLGVRMENSKFENRNSKCRGGVRLLRLYLMAGLLEGGFGSIEVA